MSLRLYNTLTRTVVPFQPLDAARVRMYVCGPTVYDFAHIGNARPVVVFDLLFRLLRQTYGADRVTYVRNITDIDDKIIATAKATGEPIAAITKRTAQAYQADMAALNALAPTHEPRATEHVAQMIDMTQRLIDKGHAYAADGHVLFHVPSMPAYGTLSRRDRDEQIAGARVEVASYKKDPADFVLWKPSADDQPGWESPWGRGRPGWHIECSAMSAELLGPVFDIHGGGQDLIFPHHENEIAQSCCAHGTTEMARVWMHNGYLMVNGEKMSKSLGNFYTVRQLLEDGWPGEAIRLTLLQTHYRQPLDFTDEALRQSRARLDRWYRALACALEAGPVAAGAPTDGFLAALSDDLHIAPALAELDGQADAVLQAAPADRAGLAAAFLGNAGLVGLLAQAPDAWFHGAGDAGEAAEIEAMIEARADARRRRDFQEADRIRDTLTGRGIVLEDCPGGRTEWRRAG